MKTLIVIGLFLLAYILGSIPFGLIIVKLKNGKDLRQVGSGRTGGTNAMRAAGVVAGIGTAIFDVLKGAGAVWLAKALLPLGSGAINAWIVAITPLFSILGHNYSIFLMERNDHGKLRLRGGAGGGPCVGGAFGLWPLSIFFIVPAGVLVFLGIGYASVTTMALGLLATLVFTYRALVLTSPWEYVVFGVLAEILLLVSLRPNITRLLNGTERMVGWRARRKRSQDSSLENVYQTLHSSPEVSSNSPSS